MRQNLKQCLMKSPHGDEAITFFCSQLLDFLVNIKFWEVGTVKKKFDRKVRVG